LRLLAQLTEQPHILDRDHRLVCESFDQRNLLRRESLDSGSR
jgi:hypothetical protein